MKDILIKPFTRERLFSTLSVHTRQNRVLHWKAIRSLWNVAIPVNAGYCGLSQQEHFSR